MKTYNCRAIACDKDNTPLTGIIEVAASSAIRAVKGFLKKANDGSLIKDFVVLVNTDEREAQGLEPWSYCEA